MGGWVGGWVGGGGGGRTFNQVAFSQSHELRVVKGRSDLSSSHGSQAFDTCFV